MAKRSTKNRAVLSFVFGLSIFAGSLAFWLLLAVAFPKAAGAAEVAEHWPFPQTMTVYGSAGLPCPAGYRQMYMGEKVALLNWRFLPPPAKPQVHRAPAHVCLDRDGGHPFIGWAWVNGIVEHAPCVFCVLGDFPDEQP